MTHYGTVEGFEAYQAQIRLLPKDQWSLALTEDRQSVCAGIYEHPAGYRHSVMLTLSDLPSDLVGLDDLHRFGIDVVGGPAVGEPQPL